MRFRGSPIAPPNGPQASEGLLVEAVFADRIGRRSPPLPRPALRALIANENLGSDFFSILPIFFRGPQRGGDAAIDRPPKPEYR